MPVDFIDHRPICLRQATSGDLPALVAIKGEGSEALHLDRLRDTQGSDLKYLVLLVDQRLVGFSLLVYRHPASWPDAEDTRHLPQIVDLQIAEAQRGQGHGTQFLRAMQRIAAQDGYRQLYLSVEPEDNPRAYALYKRLGYRQIQPEAYPVSWKFTDSRGNVHQGQEWVVDMVIELDQGG